MDKIIEKLDFDIEIFDNFIDALNVEIELFDVVVERVDFGAAQLARQFPLDRSELAELRWDVCMDGAAFYLLHFARRTGMVAVMEKVFEMASRFPEEEQELVARYWLLELNTPDFIKKIKDEIKWEKSFAESQDLLEEMAENALKEAGEGKAEQVGWDEL